LMKPSAILVITVQGEPIRNLVPELAGEPS
jgi:hypothetical protein